ncbi:MAG: arylsulfatase A-like enzyme, partial [Pseudoalteromonas tetraodonis]
MRNILALALFLLLLAGAQAVDKPNIIFFLTDDQRNDFLGCTGHPIVKTPVIDQLAAEGTLFKNAFVTTSICAASRATLFTGLYERTHGYTFGKPAVSKKHMDDGYAVQLRKAGYHTGFIGKFGVRVQKGAQQEMFNYYKPHGTNPYHKKQPDGSTRHETEVAGDRAIDFIRQAREGKKPFCLSVSFNASHAEDGDKTDHYPYPKAVAGLYESLEMPPPRHADPKVFESQPEFLKKSMNRDRYFWRWDTPEKYQHNMRNYLRMISGIDGAIGRVLAEVKELGFAENTVVIYMADNGYYAASRGFAGKWSHYEESQRVPLIIMDPRVEPAKRGKVRKDIALNVDIAPTLLKLAGIDIPNHYQGEALISSTTRKDFFCEHLMENKSIPKWEGVRGERYKYARYFSQKPVFEFLHDLQADPNEFKNLANDPASAGVLEQMRKRTDELRDAYQKGK